MRANVKGRVRNTHLPKSQPLLPLFETVINSIDAIEDSGIELSEGRIDIYIIRQPPLGLPDDRPDASTSLGQIYRFEVHDNGIGFTEGHYQAFDEADTQIKAERGGRGVGRFLWLKAFERAEIESVYSEDGNLMHRSFAFSLEVPDGIKDHLFEAAPTSSKMGTVVRLIGYKNHYASQAPKSALSIAERLVEHCLEYYMLGNMPPVLLHDDGEDEHILLDQVYESLVANTDLATFEIKGYEFDIVHFFLRSRAGLKHSISYCANGRLVRKEPIANKVPNLPPRISSEGDNGSFVYMGHVSSDYLNTHVNQFRTDFHTMPEGTDLFPGELAWSEIEEGVLSSCREALLPYTEKIRVDKEKRIREFVISNTPEYRHVVKNHPERLDSIPPQVTDEQLEIKLFEINRQIESVLRREAKEFLDENLLADEETPIEDQLAVFSRFWEEWNDVGKANLAKYIVHRKYMLSFLERALAIKDDGKYSREEIIHKIIFPLRATSDDVTFDEHNLWIIDEKLAYHRYLASDKSIGSVPDLGIDSSLRPDLVIFFDSAIAVVEEDAPFSGVVIFEFKRPMRTNYSESDNPIDQVLRYVEEIKSGTKTDKDGRPLRVPDSMPFYCYIVADITSRLDRQAKYANLSATPDGAGYFGYNQNVGAYIEILTFDKLVQDSKKRNRVLFDRLNLPDKFS